MQQTVTFVSLGPGDPELLTVKALNTLKQADVIVVPATELSATNMEAKKRGKECRSRAEDIISYWSIPAKILSYPIPMKRGGQEALKVYDCMCDDIAQMQNKGLQIAVAVEGDISIYASIHYVLQRLHARGVSVTQQPGITSFIAAASEANLALTSGQTRLMVIPGKIQKEELGLLLSDNLTVVIMKLSQCEDEIKAFVSEHQEYDIHYFENVGLNNCIHISNPANIVERSFPYFSLMIITKQKTNK